MWRLRPQAAKQQPERLLTQQLPSVQRCSRSSAGSGRAFYRGASADGSSAGQREIKDQQQQIRRLRAGMKEQLATLAVLTHAGWTVGS